MCLFVDVARAKAGMEETTAWFWREVRLQRMWGVGKERIYSSSSSSITYWSLLKYFGGKIGSHVTYLLPLWVHEPRIPVLMKVTPHPQRTFQSNNVLTKALEKRKRVLKSSVGWKWGRMGFFFRAYQHPKLWFSLLSSIPYLQEGHKCE